MLQTSLPVLTQLLCHLPPHLLPLCAATGVQRHHSHILHTVAPGGKGGIACGSLHMRDQHPSAQDIHCEVATQMLHRLAICHWQKQCYFPCNAVAVAHHISVQLWRMACGSGRLGAAPTLTTLWQSLPGESPLAAAMAVCTA